MTTQEYVIRDIKKGSTWKNSYGEFQTYAIALNGIGEPVKLNKTLPVEVEPKVGDKLYGHLTQETTGKGIIYYKFTGEARPVDEKKQSSIEAQFAIKLAAHIYIAQDYNTEEDRVSAYKNIETEAKHFYHMISKVKGE